MPFTLGDAARATGAAKSTIFRAIRAGRLSGTRSNTGQWEIEPAELFRVFPPSPFWPQHPLPPKRNATQPPTSWSLSSATVIADLREDRDRWRTAFENTQRLLPVPVERDAIPDATPQGNGFKRAWRWLRSTG